MFEIEEVRGQTAKIKVVGVGGAGGNALNTMITSNLHGVEFIAVNTDMQALETSLAPFKIQIGSNLTRGLGAGSDPQIGREAALEDSTLIAEYLEGADMVFITAGMGGGTGTGASPVIAGIAKELGAITIAVITKPFFYEGKIRYVNAEEGIKELRNNVDTLIVIPNDKIGLVVEKGTPLLKSFAIANDVLKQAVQGISDIILIPGLINVDFADVKTIIQDKGRGVMGSGLGKGEGGALEAARKAISNPLLEDSSIEGSKGILVNITGGLELSLDGVKDAVSFIYDSAHEDVHVIIGAVIDPDISDEVRVTVIATGFSDQKEKVDLPQIKKFTPLRHSVHLKGSERVLSKNLSLNLGTDMITTDIMAYEEPIDMPTFLRKSPQLQKEL
ncbi:MAG TPA: cell division protein FtsZ [Thermodesulfovibrionales bacterium]|jgi:cell division protein FtsZ|nr:cell division protein FtsZ [Thermodesulfovibrionales bacterium]HZV47473.1 cell division protein FtsZ [Thermodesulfovibrionales bacterium]